MWRVRFRLAGRDEEWNTFDEEHEARAFRADLLDSDVHGLIQDHSLEEWDGTWRPRR